VFLKEILISPAQSLTDSDLYRFLAGLIIPGVIVVAAWCFLKEKRNSPRAD
jgi:hypothetical protein